MSDTRELVEQAVEALVNRAVVGKIDVPLTIQENFGYEIREIVSQIEDLAMAIEEHHIAAEEEKEDE